MSLDGKNRVLLGKNKKEITEKINLNHKTFNKALKELEEKNMVKFVKDMGIYINPKFVRCNVKIAGIVSELF